MSDTYKGDLFDHMDPIDILLTISSERAVRHHSILGTIVLVIDRDNHGVVVLDRLVQLKCSQIVDIKLDLTFFNRLVGSSAH